MCTIKSVQVNKICFYLKIKNKHQLLLMMNILIPQKEISSSATVSHVSANGINFTSALLAM